MKAPAGSIPVEAMGSMNVFAKVDETPAHVSQRTLAGSKGSLVSAKEIVKSIEPEDGWWKSATGEDLESAAGEMLTAGMSDDQVAAILDSIVVAVGGEYGN